MQVMPIKTEPIHSGQSTIFQVLDEVITELSERSVVVITSKIVALCEGSTVPVKGSDKEQLMYREADWYYTPLDSNGEKHYHYTIIKDTFMFAAGIDASNADGNYVLWPKDPRGAANQIRKYLRERFKLKEVGVIISDSAIFPSRWGTLGLAIGHSGFAALKNYIGTQDIFGRTMEISVANIAGGIAAAAVLAMGEGSERTPIAIVSDLSSVAFQDHDPTPEELAAYYVSPREDTPFMPFFNAVEWHPGHES